MAEVSFSNAAVADLNAIDEYSLAQFGDEVSEAYMHGFVQEFALLQSYPLAGQATPKFGKDYRCLMHRRHRIYYTVQKDAVRIVRILHHAMDAKRALKASTT